MILVDPGDVVDLDLLLDRVGARVGEPVPLDEGNLFTMVIVGVDDGGMRARRDGCWWRVLSGPERGGRGWG